MWYLNLKTGQPFQAEASDQLELTSAQAFAVMQHERACISCNAAHINEPEMGKFTCHAIASPFHFVTLPLVAAILVGCDDHVLLSE